MGMSLSQRLRGFRILVPLKSRDFRLLFFGQSVSLFGDQFYLVALPLLVLDLAGSGVALGAVLMVGGISRALFDLVGGALSDRISQRAILFSSNLARALVTVMITVIAFAGLARLWHLYLLSLSFGIVDAFFFPAFLAVIPRLVDRDQLNAGNALMRGTARFMGGIGPAAAGLVITGVTASAIPGAHQSASTPAGGGGRFAVAFAIDTATFIFAAITVWLMREGRTTEVAADSKGSQVPHARGLKGLLTSIREGLAYAWRDPLIRSLLLVITVIEFSFIGPSTVGLALLARTRFAAGEPESQGAGAYASMLSAFGFGMLVGMLAAGSIRTPRRKGSVIIGLMVVLGCGMAVLGLMPNLWSACATVWMIGVGGGLSNIMLLAWLQSRTEARMLGRVLSLVMFGASVVEPLSYALAGVVGDVSLKTLFLSSGAITLAAAAVSLGNRAILVSD